MTQLFGWCMPGPSGECQDHRHCKVTFTTNGKTYTCACPRHQEA